MKRFRFIIPASLMAILFSCNNGEHAGAGSTVNPVLTPNPAGASTDTSKTDSAKASAVDTSAASLPTDTARYKKPDSSAKIKRNK